MHNMDPVNKVYWKDLIEMIKQNKAHNKTEIDFKNEKIGFKDVALLNRNGFRVPENLIEYNDAEINFSDDPDITDEDIKSGKIQWINTTEFPIDEEIRIWLLKENIKLNELIPQLIKNFYQTVKSIQKNAAV